MFVLLIWRWMVRGSGNVFNSIHCAECFELIICKGGSVIHYNSSVVTLLFEHSPSWASEIGHFEIFSCPQESQFT